MESDAARAIRRSLSAQLTKAVNTVTEDPEKPPQPPWSTYPEIRYAVISALAALNQRLRDLNDYAQEHLLISRGRTLVRFYMKGGNAFECVYNPDGPAATKSGGGNSDWDTQIIVDPWAPLPVQTQLYSLIEDIVMDEMLKVGLLIAEQASTKSPIESVELPADDKDLSKGKYALTCDKPQTLRQVFDYNRIGLWMNNRRKLTSRHVPGSDVKVEARFIPGILFNEGIQPFALYRLGYTWHAEPLQNGGVQIIRPVLMELIDVTLPRRNTVEAIAVWQELEAGVLTIVDQKVYVAGLDDQPLGSQELPLPGISYHLREIATMLCEVADRSSHHIDKLPKRFERLDKIYNSTVISVGDIQRDLSVLSGVPDITQAGGVNVESVTASIQKYAGKYLTNPTPAFALARRMMNVVASRVTNDDFQNGQIRDAVWARFKTGREALRILIRAMNLAEDIGEAGLSDDLRLMNFLYDNGYIQVDQVKFSGMYQAMVLRIVRTISPDLVAAIIKDKFSQLKAMLQSVTGPLPKDVLACLQSLVDSKITVHSRAHNTVRPTGITNENTLVVFSDARAVICLTLTSATRAEAPFSLNPAADGTMYCAPLELASQRKVEAALIEDYTIRTAISSQYDVLKRLLPGA